MRRLYMLDADRYNFPQTPAADWPAKYIGVKWQWRGRSLDDGLDCSGVLVDAYPRHFGVEITDYLAQQTAKTDQEQAHQTSQLIKQGITEWTEVKYPADGVAVLMRRAGHPIHVGMCCGLDVLHSDQGQGGVVRERRADLIHDILGYFVPDSVVIK